MYIYIYITFYIYLCLVWYTLCNFLIIVSDYFVSTFLNSFFLTLSGRAIQFGCTLCNKKKKNIHLKDEKKKRLI